MTLYTHPKNRDRSIEGGLGANIITLTLYIHPKNRDRSIEGGLGANILILTLYTHPKNRDRSIEGGWGANILTLTLYIEGGKDTTKCHILYECPTNCYWLFQIYPSWG